MLNTHSLEEAVRLIEHSPNIASAVRYLNEKGLDASVEILGATRGLKTNLIIGWMQGAVCNKQKLLSVNPDNPKSAEKNSEDMALFMKQLLDLLKEKKC